MLGHIDDVTGGLNIWYIRSKFTIDAGFFYRYENFDLQSGKIARENYF